MVVNTQPFLKPVEHSTNNVAYKSVQIKSARIGQVVSIRSLAGDAEDDAVSGGNIGRLWTFI